MRTASAVIVPRSEERVFLVRFFFRAELSLSLTLSLFSEFRFASFRAARGGCLCLKPNGY